MKNIVKLLGYILLVLALIFIPVIIYYVSLIQQKQEVEKKVLAQNIIPKQPTPEPHATSTSNLDKIVHDNFEEFGKDYGVVIKNLETGEEYRFNENKKFNSASLYKLWVMTVVFEKIRDGEIKEEQILAGSLQKFNETLSTASPTPIPAEQATPSPEETEQISMSTDIAIEKMIEFSDNYAALLLSSSAGTSSISNFLKRNNFNDSSFKSPPRTTANDIALFFELLHNRQLVNKNFSERMIDILKTQKINDRIPKYLPENIEVAHKTGELVGVKHDAGIVFTNKGNYIIVVLSDTKDPRDAAERIAKFSEDIYNYFQETSSYNPS